MKIARFKDATGQIRYGVAEADGVYEIQGDVYSQFSVTTVRHAWTEVKLLAPCSPSKIVALGLNYRAHAQEAGRELPAEPLLFLKPSTAVIGPEDTILLPQGVARVDHEAELAVVIKTIAKDVPEREALNYVLGYTCFNDVSARDLQRKDGQWTRGKSFDTFAPTGPVIATDIDPSNLAIRCLVNGEVRQSSSTAHLLFPVPTLISFISGVMTLLPGDIIATGTPEGVSPLRDGDIVEVEIEGIGTLRNLVRQR